MINRGNERPGTTADVANSGITAIALIKIAVSFSLLRDSKVELEHPANYGIALHR